MQRYLIAATLAVAAFFLIVAFLPDPEGQLPHTTKSPAETASSLPDERVATKRMDDTPIDRLLKIPAEICKMRLMIPPRHGYAERAEWIPVTFCQYASALLQGARASNGQVQYLSTRKIPSEVVPVIAISVKLPAVDGGLLRMAASEVICDLKNVGGELQFAGYYRAYPESLHQEYTPIRPESSNSLVRDCVSASRYYEGEKILRVRQLGADALEPGYQRGLFVTAQQKTAGQTVWHSGSDSFASKTQFSFGELTLTFYQDKDPQILIGGANLAGQSVGGGVMEYFPNAITLRQPDGRTAILRNTATSEFDRQPFRPFDAAVSPGITRATLQEFVQIEVPIGFRTTTMGTVIVDRWLKSNSRLETGFEHWLRRGY